MGGGGVVEKVLYGIISDKISYTVTDIVGLHCYKCLSQSSACGSTCSSIMVESHHFVKLALHYKYEHSPVLVEYTLMYLVWVTFIASGMTQR